MSRFSGEARLGFSGLNRNKISILLPDLRGGGAERVCVHLANAFAARGLPVDMVLMRARGELLPALDKRVQVVNLGALRVRQLLFPLVRYLREGKTKAFLVNLWPLTVLAPLAARLAGFRGRVVTLEHGTLSIGYSSRGALHRVLLKHTLRWGHSRADVSAAVSTGVADDLAELTGLPISRFKVIHNPVTGAGEMGHMARPSHLNGICGKLVLGVGSLKSIKRFDLLIDAFALLQGFSDATLVILGEGAERNALEQKIAECGLVERVLLPGFVLNPSPWYAHADLFVLSSDSEGLPTVLIEALEQGTPVVSTDCPSGPREILEDGKYGRLVPPGNAEALAKAMEDALASEHDRDALKRRAADFSVDKAADAYLDLLLPDWRTLVSA